MEYLITTVLAMVVSFCFSLIKVWSSSKKEAQQTAEETTTIIVKLETISSGIKDIKWELSNVKTEIKNHEARLIKLEEQRKNCQHMMGRS